MIRIIPIPIAIQVFLVLHTVDDREVALNPKEIISITKPGGQVVRDANCLIAMSDGKFLTVVEDCHDVIEKLAANKF